MLLKILDIGILSGERKKERKRKKEKKNLTLVREYIYLRSHDVSSVKCSLSKMTFQRILQLFLIVSSYREINFEQRLETG